MNSRSAGRPFNRRDAKNAETCYLVVFSALFAPLRFLSRIPFGYVFAALRLKLDAFLQSKA